MTNTRSLALQLILEGLTMGEISQRLGITRQGVQWLLKPPAAITQEVMARTRGLCERCGILARPAHIHGSMERELNRYKGEGPLMLLCMSCARMAHQKRKGGR